MKTAVFAAPSSVQNNPVIFSAVVVATIATMYSFFVLVFSIPVLNGGIIGDSLPSSDVLIFLTGCLFCFGILAQLFSIGHWSSTSLDLGVRMILSSLLPGLLLIAGWVAHGSASEGVEMVTVIAPFVTFIGCGAYLWYAKPQDNMWAASVSATALGALISVAWTYNLLV